MHGEANRLGRGTVKPVKHPAQRPHTAVARDLQGQCLGVARTAAQGGGRPVELDGVGEFQGDVAAGNLPLELGRGSLRDQPPVIEHGDLVSEFVGFVEVLGGEEDGDAIGDPDGLADLVRVARQVVTGDARVAAVGPDQGAERPHGRRLAEPGQGSRRGRAARGAGYLPGAAG